jgi:hypothetical protein
MRENLFGSHTVRKSYARIPYLCTSDEIAKGRNVGKESSSKKQNFSLGEHFSGGIIQRVIGLYYYFFFLVKQS